MALINPNYKIPAGYESLYALLEWIQSSGTQWINTGYNSAAYYVDTKFYMTNNGNSWQDLFCVENNGDPYNTYAIRTYNSTTQLTSFDSAGVSNAISIPFGSLHEIQADMTTSLAKLICDGSTIINTSISGSSNSHTMYIFNNNVGGGGGDQKSTCKLYYFNLYTSSARTAYARNMIPAMRTSDSAIGLLDVAQTVPVFYGNASGSGVFTGGSIIPKYLPMAGSPIIRSTLGGLNPVLHVTAPAGSTIDILQNSIILLSYTLSAEETELDFYVSVSPTEYTVRATLEEKTKSKTVLVSGKLIYNIALAYKLWIYDGTTEYYPLYYHYFATAGSPKQGEYATHTKTKNSDNIYIDFTPTDYKNENGAFVTNVIDITEYTKVGIDVSGSVCCSGSIWTGAVVLENTWSGDTGGMKASAKSCSAPDLKTGTSFSRGTFYANISSLTGNHHIGVVAMEWGYGGYGGYKRCNIYKLWLE